MANRWENNGNTDIFIFLGSKITADGDCSYEIKRYLLLGKKVISNLDSRRPFPTQFLVKIIMISNFKGFLYDFIWFSGKQLSRNPYTVPDFHILIINENINLMNS